MRYPPPAYPASEEVPTGASGPARTELQDAHAAAGPSVGQAPPAPTPPPPQPPDRTGPLNDASASPAPAAPAPRPPRLRGWHLGVVALVALLVGFAIGRSGARSTKGTTGTSAPTTAAIATAPPSTSPATPTTAHAPTTASGPATATTLAATTHAAPSQQATLFSASGSGQNSTPSFHVPTTSWTIEYSYDCSSVPGGTGNLRVLAYKGTSVDTVAVNEVGSGRSATSTLHDGPGTFYLQVISLCRWTVRAVTSP
jgi:hypothetical protein